MVPLSTDTLADELRARGLRVTGPRLAVYRAVRELPGHPDVDSIAAHVREELGTISTQAVYDGLRTLAAAGLLRRIEPAGSPARYETRVGDNHHHVVCRVCGSAADIDCEVGRGAVSRPRRGRRLRDRRGRDHVLGRLPGLSAKEAS